MKRRRREKKKPAHIVREARENGIWAKFWSILQLIGIMLDSSTVWPFLYSNYAQLSIESSKMPA